MKKIFLLGLLFTGTSMLFAQIPDTSRKPIPDTSRKPTDTVQRDTTKRPPDTIGNITNSIRENTAVNTTHYKVLSNIYTDYGHLIIPDPMQLNTRKDYSLSKNINQTRLGNWYYGSYLTRNKPYKSSYAYKYTYLPGIKKGEGK